MKLHLDNKQKLSEISDQFHAYFPSLKLVFFKHPHLSGEGSGPENRLNPDLSLMEARVIQSKGDISLSEDMTVAQLEQAFANSCGLSVQVFRKSGKNWLETTASDQWTLGKQNSTGMNEMPLEAEKAEDYGLHDIE